MIPWMRVQRCTFIQIYIRTRPERDMPWEMEKKISYKLNKLIYAILAEYKTHAVSFTTVIY